MNENTPLPLSVAEIRAVDRHAIEVLGIPGVVLMENAGRGCAEHILALGGASEPGRVVVLCGPGNNGGDGFVIARHLHLSRVPVDVVLAAPIEKSVGDAGVNLRIIERMGLELTQAASDPDAAERRIQCAAFVVDALLGTGSQGAPRGTIAALIAIANAAQARRVAIDIPSGLDADTGAVHAPCFHADLTITMVAPKTGFASTTAQQVLGRVVIVDIGAPQRSNKATK